MRRRYGGIICLHPSHGHILPFPNNDILPDGVHIGHAPGQDGILLIPSVFFSIPHLLGEVTILQEGTISKTRGQHASAGASQVNIGYKHRHIHLVIQCIRLRRIQHQSITHMGIGAGMKRQYIHPGLQLFPGQGIHIQHQFGTTQQPLLLHLIAAGGVMQSPLHAPLALPLCIHQSLKLAVSLPTFRRGGLGQIGTISLVLHGVPIACIPVGPGVIRGAKVRVHHVLTSHSVQSNIHRAQVRGRQAQLVLTMQWQNSGVLVAGKQLWPGRVQCNAVHIFPACAQTVSGCRTLRHGNIHQRGQMPAHAHPYTICQGISPGKHQISRSGRWLCTSVYAGQHPVIAEIEPPPIRQQKSAVAPILRGVHRSLPLHTETEPGKEFPQLLLPHRMGKIQLQLHLLSPGTKRRYLQPAQQLILRAKSRNLPLLESLASGTV